MSDTRDSEFFGEPQTADVDSVMLALVCAVGSSDAAVPDKIRALLSMAEMLSAAWEVGAQLREEIMLMPMPEGGPN